jgi:hypothetical protein
MSVTVDQVKFLNVRFFFSLVRLIDAFLVNPDIFELERISTAN